MATGSEYQQAEADIAKLQSLLPQVGVVQRALMQAAMVQARSQMLLAARIAESVEFLREDGVRLTGLYH